MPTRRAASIRAAIRSLGPASSGGTPWEAIRAGVGSLLGMAVVGAVLACSGVDLTTGLFMIAPFGATTVLVFAAPSSPLAQPWPTVVGSVLSAVVGVAVTLTVSQPILRVVLAVGLAVTAMIACRAVHPPAGAVALTAALSPDTVHALGFRFALAPVAVGVCLLVVVAAVYGRATRRHYPFRQFAEEPRPTERLGLTEDELTGILARYRQSLNLGVADLARLIGAAELQAAGHRTDPLDAASVMSRDLITVAPDTTPERLAQLFGEYGFTSLPVIADDGSYAGVVFQIHLVTALAGHRTPVGAADVMDVDLPVAHPDTPVAALLPLLADGGCDAVPVLDGGQIVGIVTQTDLITALARRTLRADEAGPAPDGESPVPSR
ncbi:HPP family protein [Gordonia sp. NPDC003376]